MKLPSFHGAVRLFGTAFTAGNPRFSISFVPLVLRRSGDETRRRTRLTRDVQREKGGIRVLCGEY